MASSKKQTTMAKMARERAVREKRELKQAKKEARKQAAAEQADEAGNGSVEPGSQGSSPSEAEPQV
jgi:hypothetical protein